MFSIKKLIFISIFLLSKVVYAGDFESEYLLLLKQDIINIKDSEAHLALLKKLAQNPSEISRSDRMYCWNHDFSDNYQEGVNYADQKILTSYNNDDVIDFTLCKAIYLYTLGSKKETLDILNNIKPKLNSVKDENILTNYYLIKANIESEHGDLYAGLQNYISAKKIFEKLNYKTRVNGVLLSIGDLYRRFGDSEKAKTYYSEIFKHEMNHEKDLNLIQSVHLGLGFLALEDKNYQESLKEFELVKDIDDKNNKGNKVLESSNNLNIAISQAYLGNIVIAKNLLNNAEKILSENNNPIDFGFLKLYQGIVLEKQNRYKESLDNFKIAERIFNKVDNNRYKLILYKNEIELFEKLNDTKNALKYMHLKDHIEDVLQNNLKISETIYLKEKFDSQKKEVENSHLKIEQELNQQQMKNLEKLRYWQVIALILTIGIIVLLFYWTYKLIEKNKKLKNLAMTDELTKIANRRYIMQVLDKKVIATSDKKEDLSVIVLDIDFFKRINDTYGHKHGDYVLCEVSKKIKNCLRKTDLLGRIGGEEFLIILENTTISEAELVGEKIKDAINDLELHIDGNIIKITISLGISQHVRETTSELIANADKSLYVSKNTGKNKVSVYLDNLENIAI